MPCGNNGGAIDGMPIGWVGDMFMWPVGSLADTGNVADGGVIIGGGGGVTWGLVGGDLLAPVSRRLFAILASISSGRSRFRLRLEGNDGMKDCLRAISFANMDRKSAYS